MSDEASVTTWIKSLKHGDHQAAERLWARYFDKLVVAARRRLLSVEKRAFDEEDVVVSVFESLCRAAERGNFTKLSDRDDLWALLLVLTRQKAVDRIRHEARAKRGGGKVRGESVFVKANPENSGWGIADVVAEEPNPQIIADLQEEHQRLLSLLPNESVRRVAQLRMEGHSTKEIAAEFGFTTRWAERKLQLIRKTWKAEFL